MSEQSDKTPTPPPRLLAPVAIGMVAVYMFIEWKFCLLESTSTIGSLSGMAVCFIMFLAPVFALLARLINYDHYYEAITKRQWLLYREKKCPCCERPISNEGEDDAVRKGWSEITRGYTSW